MSEYALLIPELLVGLAAAWALFAEYLPGRDRGAAWVGAALSIAAALVAAFAHVVARGPFGGLLAFDGPARFARVSMAVLAALWLLWTAGRAEGRTREASSLVLLSLVGCMLMVEARELVTLLLALELATMPSYVLIGYRRGDVRSLEGALKYFLLSMLTTLVMLYGFSFVYGITGTTRYAGFDLSKAGALGLVAVMLSLIGLFAKLSAAPFHYWAPDAYAGSSPWAVSFVSTVPKIAGAVAMVRLLGSLAPGAPTAVVVVNFAGVPHEQYRLALPGAGTWTWTETEGSA